MENKVKEKLLPLLRETKSDLEFEYVIDGIITPAYRFMMSVTVVGLLIGYVTYMYLGLNGIYGILIALVVLYVGLQLLYVDVYLAKYGKRVFIYKKGFLRKEEVDIHSVTNCVYLEEGSDNIHVNIHVKINGVLERVTIKRDAKETAEKNQIIQRFIGDMGKKKK